MSLNIDKDKLFDILKDAYERGENAGVSSVRDLIDDMAGKIRLISNQIDNKKE